MAAGVVHIPWYATGLRSDDFEDHVARFAALSIAYGAIDYQVFRSRDDRYKFLQTVTWETKLDWERYWESDDAIAFRVNHSGWYQVPLLYVWNDLVVSHYAPAEGHPGAQPVEDDEESPVR